MQVWKKIIFSELACLQFLSLQGRHPVQKKKKTRHFLAKILCFIFTFIVYYFYSTYTEYIIFKTPAEIGLKDERQTTLILLKIQKICLCAYNLMKNPFFICPGNFHFVSVLHILLLIVGFLFLLYFTTHEKKKWNSKNVLPHELCTLFCLYAS